MAKFVGRIDTLRDAHWHCRRSAACWLVFHASKAHAERCRALCTCLATESQRDEPNEK